MSENIDLSTTELFPLNNYTRTSNSKSSSIFINIIIILVIVGIIWLLFGTNSETFSTNTTNSNNVLSPNGMMGINAGKNLMAELSDVKGYTDSNASVLTNAQKIMEKSNPTLMTPDERSLYEMNKVARKNSKGTGCNLLGIDPSKLSNYKKKYYNMYKHQIQCPSNCNLSQSGEQDCYMSKLGMKKCGLDSSDDNCGGIFTSNYNNPDVFALGYLALDNNNAKPCVTCTFKPSGNNLDRSDINPELSVFNSSPLPPYNPENPTEYKEGFSSVACPYYTGKPSKAQIIAQQAKESFAMIKENYNDLSPETIAADEARLFKQNVSNANVSNYVDFENNTMLNSTSGETQVDKLAEIRTCVSGTCGLTSYGKNISNVFDKLLETPAYTNRASCDPNMITGVLEDSAMASQFSNP